MQFERWRDGLANDGNRTRKTVNKIATQAHAIFEHAVDHFELPTNVASKVKRLREPKGPGRLEFFSPQEVAQLAASAARGAHRDPSRPAVSDRERKLRAQADQQDAALFLTAALAGLRRSELLALHGTTSTSSTP